MKRILSRIFTILPAVLLQIIWYLLLLNWLNNIFPFINEVLSICAFIFVLHIASNYTESNYKLMWILLIVLFPILGAWLYILCGETRSTNRLNKNIEKAKMNLDVHDKTSEELNENIKQKDEHLFQTLNTISKNNEMPVHYIKDCKYYSLGDSMFPDMLKALKGAKKFIYMEYFIIEEGIFLNSMVDIFKEKVKEGVDVRVLYDDIGSISTYSLHNIKELNKYGIKCIPFNPAIFVKFQLNNRDHRKMLVIDNEIAFSGGVNIADEYINVKEKYGHWKDIGFSITGDGVNNYTFMFAQIWNSISNDKIQMTTNFENRNEHNGYILSYYDSPSNKVHTSRQFLLETFYRATKRVWIYTPYLILDDSVVEGLCALARRNVDVRIMIPGIPDKKIVYRLTMSFARQLLKEGIQIYQYTPGFLHAKAWLIDEDLCSIGTVNLDYRSLFLHYECNSIFYQSSIFHSLKKDMEQTMEMSKQMKEEDCKQSIIKNLWDDFLRLFAPLL